MGKTPAKKEDGSKPIIKILLVDDMRDAREGIQKLLQFESEFQVVGQAANGREGVAEANRLKPDIVIMDINMPDMDGLEAAAIITRAMPQVGVIMLSVQDDQDYFQRAMLAGARFFLPKPPDMDRLYTTIRTVYEQNRPLREKFAAIDAGQFYIPQEEKREGELAGHIIVVYSSTGGAGCTVVATSLASGLMREGIKTLLVDGDLQFGDVGAFLDLRSQQNLIDVVETIKDEGDELDVEYFENIIASHNSGMKVLLGPPRPAMGIELRDENPGVVARMVEQIAPHYDFLVVDVGKSIDAVTFSVLQKASKIVLLVNPTLPSIKNTRLVLDLLESQELGGDRICLVVNKGVVDPRQSKGIATEKIQQYLKRQVEGVIPAVSEQIILNAINKGIPVIASDRDTSKSPIKELLALSNHLYKMLMGEEEETDQPAASASSSWLRGIIPGGKK